MPRAYVSSVITAPIAEVWARVRNFNGLPGWHPRIRDSRIESAEPADKVGCIREIHLQNGDRLREQLLGLSDYDLFCSYSILEGPMPLTDYVATLRVTPVTDGNRTYIEWAADFNCEPDAETDLVTSLEQNVFQPGFDALKRHFRG